MSLGKGVSHFPTYLLVEEAGWKGGELGGEGASLEYLPPLTGILLLLIPCHVELFSTNKKFSVQKL